MSRLAQISGLGLALGLGAVGVVLLVAGTGKDKDLLPEGRPPPTPPPAPGTDPIQDAYSFPRAAKRAWEWKPVATNPATGYQHWDWAPITDWDFDPDHTDTDALVAARPKPYRALEQWRLNRSGGTWTGPVWQDNYS